MVKNICGGSKSKKMASKNFKNSNINRNLRISQDNFECYGIITEKLGGGHMRAMGIDGNKYMVSIGGKFRNERINKYDFILFGLRDWQTNIRNKDKDIKTDLLEVYNEQEKNKLLKLNGLNWQNLLQYDNSNFSFNSENDDNFNFSNETETEYKELLEKQLTEKIRGKQNEEAKENGDLNIDTDFDIDFI